jgi:hypothetical protein
LKSAKRPNWGFTFAERPACGSPGARLLWHARHDPGVLRVSEGEVSDDDLFDLRNLRTPTVVAVAPDGREHVAISDGFRRIRLDVIEGSLLAGSVMLHYHLRGLNHLDGPLLSLRRLIALVRTGRFALAPFPADHTAPRIVTALRVHDALVAGASQRDIAIGLFGVDIVNRDWLTSSDFLRSRVRRLVALARRLEAGGWRELLH